MEALSTDMLQCAKLLRSIRSRLNELIRAGTYPHDLFRDISRILCESSYVADSLERLASNEPPLPTPTYLDERR